MLLQQVVNGIVLGSVYALFGLGFNLVLGALNILNIAHAAVFTWGAFIGLYLVTQLHWPLALVLLLAMLATGLLSIVVEWLAIRPLRRKRSSELAPVVSTLGASIVLLAFAQWASGSQIVRFPLDTFPNASIPLFGGAKITVLQLVILASSTAIMLITYLFLQRSRVGKAVRTVAYDELTAQILGINTNMVVSVTFFLAGALAGAAGVLTGLAFNSVHFMMGDPYLLKGFVVIVVGGFGSVAGVILASLLLGQIEVFSVVIGSGAFRDAIAFGLLFLILVFRPYGLFGQEEEVRP
jgi:branched-chain amino acid transport system permease protein